VRRAALLGLGAALLFVAAGCGGSSNYDLAKTRACFAERGAKISGKLDDFVASTATGGAFVAKLKDNSIVVVVGQSADDARQIEDAYHRFAFANVRAGIADVVRRYKNVVMRWQMHPRDSDLALAVACLR
jgi:hypothetical protein